MTSYRNFGFTLIEIILTIAIMSIIVGSSYAALIKFSSQQTLNSAYGVLKNNLNLAKSLASSQVVNCSPNYTLVGYEMDFPLDNTTYEIKPVCQNTAGQKEPKTPRSTKLPSGITIDSDFKPILFLVISGEVQDIPPAGAEITLTGNGGSTRSVIVFPNGRTE